MASVRDRILQRVYDGEALLPSEVALLFRVDPKTVSRWCDSNMIYSFKTIGGHRRIPASEITSRLDMMRHGA